MSLDHVAVSDGVYYVDFLAEQALKRQAFIYNKRLGFTADVSRYFSHGYQLTELQLSERRTEVRIRLINLS